MGDGRTRRQRERAVMARERLIDRIWMALRLSRQPLTVRQIADMTGASDRQVRRVVTAAVAAAHVERVDVVVEPHTHVSGAAVRGRYAATAAAPEVAPIMRVPHAGGPAAAVAIGRRRSA